MRVPPPFEVGEVAFREAGVIEDDGGFRVMRLQFETDDGVEAGFPGRGTPCLHDSLVGDELDVAPFDELSEEGKGAACRGIDFGRPACQCGRPGSRSPRESGPARIPMS